MKQVNIYFDVCCLNRPFDIQKHDLIRIEAEAVIAIIKRLLTRKWRWVSSDVVNYEISRTEDYDKRNRLELLAQRASLVIPWSEKIEKRGAELEDLGFAPLDAMHIGSAEEGKVDILFTTDKKFLRCAQRNDRRIGLLVENPVSFVLEDKKHG